jgi:hypothetical protein
MGSKEAMLTFANTANEDAPYSVYCNGSGFEGGTGTSAVMFADSQEVDSLHYHIGPISQHTVYKAKIIGLMLGLHLLSASEKLFTFH